eukprot:6076342-Amphidinium_carterae.2
MQTYIRVVSVFLSGDEVEKGRDRLGSFEFRLNGMSSCEACVDADEKFEKGHLRLLIALDTAGANLSDREAACSKARATWVESPQLT